MSLSVFSSVKVSFWCQLYYGSQGEVSQGDGQELPQSPFHVSLVSHCYSHTPATGDNCSSRIIPKISIPTVLICELCSSLRALLVIPGGKYPHFLANARISKDSLTSCSNWGKCHIILTCCLKLYRRQSLSPQSYINELKNGNSWAKTYTLISYSFLC